MGKFDLLTTEYMSDTQRFADAFKQDESYQHISIEAAQIISKCAGISIDLNGKEEVNMTTCYEELIKYGKSEGRLEGEILGRIKLARELNLPIEQIIENLVKTYGMTHEEAEEKIQTFL